MSITGTIRIQKMQNKNRMVGKTFNPGGHTSESLDLRERQEIERIKNLSQSDFIKLGNQYQALADFKEENNHHYSNSFEQNVFIRNFNLKFANIKKSITSKLVVGQPYEVLTFCPNYWHKVTYQGMRKETLKSRELHDFKGCKGVYSVLVQELPIRIKQLG